MGVLKTLAFPTVSIPSVEQHGKEGSSRGPKGDESDEGQEGIKVSSMKSCVMLPAGPVLGDTDPFKSSPHVFERALEMSEAIHGFEVLRWQEFWKERFARWYSFDAVECSSDSPCSPLPNRSFPGEPCANARTRKTSAPE